MATKKAQKPAELKISGETIAEVRASIKASQPYYAPLKALAAQRFYTKTTFNASAKYKRTFEIKNRHLDRVIFVTEAPTLKDAVEEAAYLGVDLWGANLQNADLGEVFLGDVQLSNADFSGANLCKAILTKSTLVGARFCNVDLRSANIRYANLKKAVLKNSALIDAKFLEADLTRADFRGSDLAGAELQGANITGTLFDPRPKAPEEGSFVGWKEVFDKQGNPIIAKLLIPEEAKRTTPLVGRVCRAEFVKVLELTPAVSFAKSRYCPDQIYRVGKIVRARYYADDVQLGYAPESAFGIGFYLTREEAEQNSPAKQWFRSSMSVLEYWKSKTYKEWAWVAKHLREIERYPERYPEITQFNAKLRAMGLR
jgi:hypothetical protein